MALPPAPALRRKHTRERLRTLGFLSPWLVGFTVFFGYPLIATVYFSFMHYNQIEQPDFVGLKNWKYCMVIHRMRMVEQVMRVD